MANSRLPGALNPPMGFCKVPARTCGVLGLWDQGDPNMTTLLGDTCGPLGMLDWGAPWLPAWSTVANKSASTPVRAPDGQPLSKGSATPAAATTGLITRKVLKAAQHRPTDVRDFFGNPDQVVTVTEFGVESAFFTRNTKNVNATADGDDVAAVTLKINGGSIGLPHRTARPGSPASRPHWEFDMNQMMRFGVVALLLASPLAHADDDVTMCGAHEVVVFSCHVGKKIASLCHPAGAAQALSYRFGLTAKTELLYPDVARGEVARFASSTSVLYGGGAQTVTFRRGDYEYGLYSVLTRSDDGNGADGGDRTPVFEDGLVVSRAGKQVRKMVCDDGGLGFRDNIDWIQAK